MANAKVNRVIVDRFLEQREGHNADYRAVILRQETFSGNFLNSGMEKRCAIQNIHVNQIEAMGIEEGIDLCAVTSQDLKLVITELTSAEFSTLDESERFGFQEKINPITKDKLLTSDGQSIFRKVECGPANTADIKVAHVRVKANQNNTKADAGITQSTEFDQNTASSNVVKHDAVTN